MRRDAMRYVWRAALGAVSICAVLTGLAVALTATGTVQFEHAKILKSRLAHLEATRPPVDIVFVGDSSLGAGIDPELFERMSGRASASLDLTGSFGYVGTANMLERAAERWHPKIAFIVQTTDVAARKPDPLADVETRPEGYRPADLLALARLYASWATVARLGKGLIELAEGNQRGKAAEPGRNGSTDAGRASRDRAALARNIAERREDPLEPREIDPAAADSLQRIATICRENGMECVYAHGPLVGEFCVRERPYIERINGLVRAAGLTLLTETPLCLPAERMSDQIDHVAAGYRDDATSVYYALAASLLQSKFEGVTAPAGSKPRV